MALAPATRSLLRAESHVRLDDRVQTDLPGRVPLPTSPLRRVQQNWLPQVETCRLSERLRIVDLTEVLDQPAHSSRDGAPTTRCDSREVRTPKLSEFSQDRRHVREATAGARLPDEVDDCRLLRSDNGVARGNRDARRRIHGDALAGVEAKPDPAHLALAHEIAPIGDHLEDLGRLMRGTVYSRGTQEADVVRPAEVAHHRVDEPLRRHNAKVRYSGGTATYSP